MSTVRIGLIGGGLMGRELASALGRWCALQEPPAAAELVAVCDMAEPVREWFRRIPSVRQFTAEYRELLANREVDVVYVAVPHHLHREIYCAVLEAGKDLMAEKPFGIDLADALAIGEAAKASGRFVRCSSEFPFFPGARLAFEYARAGNYGRLLEVRSGFWHSSDLDPTKPANWKRQSRTCGRIGAMGDLGMHAAHLPLRLGWRPKSVYAQLQRGVSQRPDGRGGTAECDTWDNALLHMEIETPEGPAPLQMEMKRLAPGATNTWYFELLGTDGGVRFSTQDPKALWTFQRGKTQQWSRTDLGHEMAFPTVTGGIFESGFPDCYLQMWAAYLAERASALGDRFGCVTVEEAVQSHRWFDAALRSHETHSIQMIS